VKSANFITATLYKKIKWVKLIIKAIEIKTFNWPFPSLFLAIHLTQNMKDIWVFKEI